MFLPSQDTITRFQITMVNVLVKAYETGCSLGAPVVIARKVNRLANASLLANNFDQRVVRDQLYFSTHTNFIDFTNWNHDVLRIAGDS